MAIRFAVFVEEQKVPRDEEVDEHEANCRHLLARVNGQEVGTARYRRTMDGYKLERFAVLKDHRKTGAGGALLQAILRELKAAYPVHLPKVYLHAQEAAVPFYYKHGFVKVGSRFYEAEIPHFKMVYNPELPHRG